MEDEIIVIDKIEEAEDNKGKTYLKITDKAGTTRNFKEGRSNLLTNKGHLLIEGKAIKLHFADYKAPSGQVFPFVKDFEVVADEFVAQATKKVQTQTKDTREDSIESQVAFKGMVELWIADKLGDKAKEATVNWAMARINLPSVIMGKIEEAKSETAQDNTSDKEAQGELADRQDSRETTESDAERVNGFLKYLEEHGKKDPRLWLDVEYGIPQDTILTPKKCELLYKAIKNKEKW